MYVCMFVCMCMYVCMYVCVCMYLCIYMYVVYVYVRHINIICTKIYLGNGVGDTSEGDCVAVVVI